jgi:hypothetical protein
LKAKFEIIFHPHFVADLQSGIEYYELQQIGLGLRFNETVKDAVDSIQSNPFYQIRYDNIRCFATKKFPFLLHFEIDEIKQIILVHSLVHTSRNPDEYWVKKKK